MYATPTKFLKASRNRRSQVNVGLKVDFRKAFVFEGIAGNMKRDSIRRMNSPVQFVDTGASLCDSHAIVLLF